MNIPWDDLELFLAVAEERSFSAAARKLQISQPTVSRRVGALEERLARALFARTVEGTELTPEGVKLLPAALQMARFAGELTQIAEGFDASPSGVVRIALPPGAAHDFLVPFARDLQSELPDIRIHAIAGVEHLDLSRGGAELALRSRHPGQPELMVLAHARVPVGIFASRAYRKRCADKPALADIDWISWAYPNEHFEPTPTLKKLIVDFSPRFASNDFNVQTRAAIEGLGAMILPRTASAGSWLGALVELDVGLAIPDYEYYLVCAKTMRWAPRVQVVARHLIEALRRTDGLELLSSEF